VDVKKGRAKIATDVRPEMDGPVPVEGALSAKSPNTKTPNRGKPPSDLPSSPEQCSDAGSTDDQEWGAYVEDCRLRGIEVERSESGATLVKHGGRNWTFNFFVQACLDAIASAKRASDGWCAKEPDPDKLEKVHKNIGRWLRGRFVQLRAEINAFAADTPDAPIAPRLPPDSKKLGVLEAAGAGMRELAAHAGRLEKLELKYLREGGHLPPGVTANKQHERTDHRRRAVRGTANRKVAEYLVHNGYRRPPIRVAENETGIPRSSIDRTPAWRKFRTLCDEDRERRDFSELRDFIDPDASLRALIKAQDDDETKDRDAATRARRHR
jgi:hypothetical protein